MKCPFCDKDMQTGIISGDGRSKVIWEQTGQKLGVMDKLVGKGMIDAEYTLSKFKINAQYCDNCKKMIFDSNITK